VRTLDPGGVVLGDCNRDCHDPNRTLKVSLEEDMIRIALARPKYEGRSLDVLARESDRMWKRLESR